MPSKARTTSNNIVEAGTTTSATTATAAPFFTLAIEGPNTAVALDAFGVEIVSLHFEDFNDLTSDSFREYATAAVIAMTSSSSGRRSLNKEAENEAVISLLDSESDDDNDVDMDEIFAAVLAENEAARAVEHLDADLALALCLQEEELELEKKKRLAAGINSNKGAWGTHPSFLLSSSSFSALEAAPQPTPLPPKAIKEAQSSFSNTMGTAPGIPIISNMNATTNRASDIEFPSLPPPTKQQPQEQQRPQKRVPLKTTMASERSTGIRKLHTSSTTNTNSTSININKEQLTALDDFDYLNHHSNRHHNNNQQQQLFSVNGGDLSTIQFLDSYDKEAIESRATALRFAQAAAAKENNNTSTATAAAAASRQAIKKMMDTTSSSRRMNTSQEENNEEEDIVYNGRKKIRTLVMSMIASGWEFLPDRRGSGHYIYQRFIPPTGHKQILVLPCTPSSQRSIDAVQARLQRMDREAAEVRAKAKPMTATP